MDEYRRGAGLVPWDEPARGLDSLPKPNISVVLERKTPIQKMGKEIPPHVSQSAGILQCTAWSVPAQQAYRSKRVYRTPEGCSCFTGWEEKGKKADPVEEGKLEKHRQPAPLDLCPSLKGTWENLFACVFAAHWLQSNWLSLLHHPMLDLNHDGHKPSPACRICSGH